MSGQDRQEQPAAGCRGASGGHKNQPAAGTSSDKGEDKFECPECGKTFPSGRVLLFHKRAHTNDKKHQCKECGQRFTLKYNLDLHALTHKSEGYHKCEECGQAFTQKCHFDIHMLTHTVAGHHKCKECGQSFTLKYDLDLHMHTLGPGGHHKCEMCGQMFAQECDLDRHTLTHTGRGNCDSDYGGAQIKQDTDLLTHIGITYYASVEGGEQLKQEGCHETLTQCITDNIVKCEVEEEMLKQGNGLDTHCLTHTHVKGEGNEGEVTVQQENDPDTHRLTHTHVQCEGNEGEVTVQQENDPDTHRLTHIDVGNHGCEDHSEHQKQEICPDTDPLANTDAQYDSEELNVKMKEDSSLEINSYAKTYERKDCGKMYWSTKDLKKHTVRRSVIYFPCEVCGKSFTQKATLNRHMQRHTGDMKHECYECGKKLPSNSKLLRHLSVHNATGRLETMLSKEQHRKIAAWQEKYRSPVVVQHLFREAYCTTYAPSRPMIYAIHAKSVEGGHVNDQP